MHAYMKKLNKKIKGTNKMLTNILGLPEQITIKFGVCGCITDL